MSVIGHLACTALRWNCIWNCIIIGWDSTFIIWVTMHVCVCVCECILYVNIFVYLYWIVFMLYECVFVYDVFLGCTYYFKKNTYPEDITYLHDTSKLNPHKIVIIILLLFSKILHESLFARIPCFYNWFYVCMFDLCLCTCRCQMMRRNWSKSCHSFGMIL